MAGLRGETYTRILNLLASGLSQAEVAREMGMSPQAVWYYVSTARKRGELPRSVSEPSAAFTYFVRVGRFVKIGRAKNLQTLMQMFEEYSPQQAQMLGAVWGSDEQGQRLALSIRARHAHGQWLHATTQLLRQIKTVCMKSYAVDRSDQYEAASGEEYLPTSRFTQ